MKYVIIFLLCLVAVQALTETKLTPKYAGGRVIQGWPAVNGQFPHMAYLSIGCGGSLIHEKWVLTAAHCVLSNRINVYLGDIRIGNSPIVVTVTKIHPYPGYNPSNLNNDIALLEFDDPVTFTDTIKPIPIARSRNELYVGEIATLSGFGQINDQQQRPDVLQFVNMTIISNSQCADYFGSFIVESTICANGLDTPAQGSCFGDSGSGLIIRRPEGDTLVGVTSFIGWEGCEGHNPSGYVRPNFYLDWIRELTGLDV